MFDDLPETIPHKQKGKPRAIALAALIQVVLVSAIILIQMVMPEKLGEFQLLTTLYMAAPPPPPPALSAAPPAHHPAQKAVVAETSIPEVVEQQPEPTEKPEFTAPVTIPKDIAKIVDAGPPHGTVSSTGGGVAGGVSAGVAGGLLGGVLGAAGNVPLPPAPPAAVRVGGNVKEPKVVHIEQPKYPPEAKRAHAEGVVILEATLTPQGNVDKVKVISGPALLVESAVEAVSHWKYEPTYLNGQAVPVILTARITFSLSNTPQ
jgi:periplasmic protein TonB